MGEIERQFQREYSNHKKQYKPKTAVKGSVFSLIVCFLAVVLYVSYQVEHSKAIAPEKKRALTALSNLKKVEGDYAKRREKRYKTALQTAKSAQDYTDLANKWETERKNWLAAEPGLKKMSGGLVDSHPADIVQKKKELAGLVKEIFAHRADVKEATALLGKVEQYIQLSPSEQVYHHAEIKNQLQLMVEKLRQDKEPEILDVPLINQMPELDYGCEVTSLAMILQDAGIGVTKTELAKKIPKVPITDENGLKGNPNIGFIGDIRGSQPGYFVYHQPIAELAETYAGGRVQDLTGEEISKVYQKLDEGIPVWVITTTDFAPDDNLKIWETSQGKLKISLKEHSVVLTGYSKKYVWLNNPYGHKNQKVDRRDFEQSWIEMGRQAIIINSAS